MGDSSGDLILDDCRKCVNEDKDPIRDGTVELIVRNDLMHCLEVLVMGGIDINLMLLEACSWNSPECAKFLLDHKADVNTRRPLTNATVLMIAATEWYNVDLMTLLLERKASLCSISDGRMPIKALLDGREKYDCRSIIEEHLKNCVSCQREKNNRA